MCKEFDTWLWSYKYALSVSDPQHLWRFPYTEIRMRWFQKYPFERCSAVTIGRYIKLGHDCFWYHQKRWMCRKLTHWLRKYRQTTPGVYKFWNKFPYDVYRHDVVVSPDKPIDEWDEWNEFEEREKW